MLERSREGKRTDMNCASDPDSFVLLFGVGIGFNDAGSHLELGFPFDLRLNLVKIAEHDVKDF